MPHSLADLLIHIFFSTKDQRPILDDDLRLNLQKHEIEYDETYLWPRLCAALSRARLCLDHSPRLKPRAGVSTFLRPPGRLTRISHRLTGQAHERPAITSLRLLAVLNGL